MTTAKPKPRRPDKSDETIRLTAEALTKISLPTHEFEIDALGGTVVIQAFSGKTSRIVREATNHNPGSDKNCTFCHKTWPCAFEGQVDQDVYERKLVEYGLIDPKLTEEEVEILFEEQWSGVGRMIAFSVMMLNASGKAPEVAKDSGQTTDTDLSSS